MTFLYLTQEEVIGTGFDMKQALEVVEKCLKLHAESKTVLPSKVVLDLDERERGRINAMPGYLGGEYDVCGIKWIAGFPKNPKNLGIPRAHAFIIINDSETGVAARRDGRHLYQRFAHRRRFRHMHKIHGAKERSGTLHHRLRTSVANTIYGGERDVAGFKSCSPV